MNMHNDLHDFMQAITREIQYEYKRIRKRTKDDPGTAGDEGEKNWATIFEDYLPSNYHVVTKGRILGVDGTASPQVDILILHPFYPKKLRDKKQYLAAGVIAAFECKNTLKAQHIKEAIETSIAIKQLIPSKKGSCFNEMYCPIAYGLLAHSHNWKKRGSKPRENISHSLETEDINLVTNPYHQLDFLCVSDVASWSIIKRPMTNGYSNSVTPEIIWKHGPSTGYNVQSKEIYIHDEVKKDNFTPVGAFLTKLLQRMAMTDPALKDFAAYYKSVLAGAMNFRLRHWPEKTLTEAARDEVDAIPKEIRNLLLFTDI